MSVLYLARYGRGANLFPTARAVGPHGQVIGIDLAEGMVRETTDEIERQHLQNASMLSMDAEYSRRHSFPLYAGGGKGANYSELPQYLSQTGFIDVQTLYEEADFAYTDAQL